MIEYYYFIQGQRILINNPAMLSSFGLVSSSGLPQEQSGTPASVVNTGNSEPAKIQPAPPGLNLQNVIV